MKEGDYWSGYDPNESELIHDRDYQSAAIVLLYNARDLASPSAHLRPPRFVEGRKTAAFELTGVAQPHLAQYSLMFVVVYPSEGPPKNNELAATIQLIQPLDIDRADDWDGPPPELALEFHIFFTQSKYRVQQERKILRELGKEMELDSSIATLEEISILNGLFAHTEILPPDG